MKVCRTTRWRRDLCWLVLALSFAVAYGQSMAQNNSAPSRDVNAVLAAHDKELLAIPGVVGVYVATLKDGRTTCLKVMLARKNPETERKIPSVIEGYVLVIEITGEIRALSTP